MSDKYDGAKFVHFAPDYEPHYGGATVAYKLVGDKAHIAVAHCNPNDRYDYAYGRAKSAGLLKQLGVRPELDGAVCYAGIKYLVLDPVVFKDEGVVAAISDIMDSEGYLPRRRKQ